MKRFITICLLFIGLSVFAEYPNYHFKDSTFPYWRIDGGVWKYQTGSVPPVTNSVLFYEFLDQTECENGDYHDSTIFNNDGTQAVANARGAWSTNGITFETDEHIDASAVVAELQNSDVGAVSFWLKMDTLDGPGTSQHMFGVTDKSDPQSGLTVYFNEDGDNLTIYCWQDGQKYNSNFTGAPSLATNVWFHIFVVQDGVSPVLYLDSISYPIEDAATPTAWYSTVSDLDAAHVGAWAIGGTVQTFLYGTMKDVRVFTNVPSASFITNLYNEGP